MCIIQHFLETNTHLTVSGRVTTKVSYFFYYHHIYAHKNRHTQATQIQSLQVSYLSLLQVRGAVELLFGVVHPSTACQGRQQGSTVWNRCACVVCVCAFVLSMLKAGVISHHWTTGSQDQRDRGLQHQCEA